MESMTLCKKVLIFTVAIVYIIHLVLNALAAQGGPDSKLFPNTVSNISRAFQLELTPVGATFSIWGVIFTWQLLWIIYTITTVFRSGPATNVLSKKFFIAFIVNIIFISAWLFTWAREEGVISFVVIVLGQIFLDIAIGFALSDLKKFLDDQLPHSRAQVDLWSQRILVQNGTLFYGTWTTVATLINLAVVLAYYMDLATKTASLVSLSILGVVALTWFVLENFVIKNYTEYTLSPYIVLIIALTGIYVNKESKGNAVGKLALALLILSAVLLVVRLVIIIVRHVKAKNKPTEDVMASAKYTQNI